MSCKVQSARSAQHSWMSQKASTELVASIHRIFDILSIEDPNTHYQQTIILSTYLDIRTIIYQRVLI